ncbi:type II secretion system protein [Candidatus Saccharibacteria bacterium]|nr:type II secretion system protein [Candidatus Saccharibacteria bacterium]MBQ1539971.1 type II secretion system protein [Candidatus Saccharibacteria bacterium]
MKKGEIKHGFTIIEVVLVLAVAGLIFVMVFVALPALQRAQRDNSRRDDMMNFISKVKRYQTSNRGALPKFDEVKDRNVEYSSGGNSDSWGGFYHDYLGDRFVDPDGENYKLTVMKCEGKEGISCGKGYNDYLEKLPSTPFGTAPNDYRIMVVLQAKCSGTEAVGSSNPRNLAVVYRLEGSGAYCFNT